MKPRLLQPIKTAIITTLLLSLATPLYSFRIPAIYQCRAVRVTRTLGNGKTSSKAFQVLSLFVRFDHSEMQVFGTQYDHDICRKLGIRGFFGDTVYLQDPEVPFSHSDLKLYMVNDTIMGNVNLFESDTSNISVKVLVKKVLPNQVPDYKKMCR
jgi:hypothetical protein